jgi:hypothetical protein
VYIEPDLFIKYFQGDFALIFNYLHQADGSSELAILSAALMAVILAVTSRDVVYLYDGVFLRRIIGPLTALQTLPMTPLLLKASASILVFADRVLSVESKVCDARLSQRTVRKLFQALRGFAMTGCSLAPLALANLVRVGALLVTSGMTEVRTAARAVVRAFRVAVRTGNGGRDCFPAISVILACADRSSVLSSVLANKRFPYILRWLQYSTGKSLGEITSAASDHIRLRLDLAGPEIELSSDPEIIMQNI